MNPATLPRPDFNIHRDIPGQTRHDHYATELEASDALSGLKHIKLSRGYQIST